MIQEITERLNVKIHIETLKLQVFKKRTSKSVQITRRKKITHEPRVDMMISADIVG